MEMVLLNAQGDVVQIVTTGRNAEQLAADWPDYQVLPIEEVPDATQRCYEYWARRS